MQEVELNERRYNLMTIFCLCSSTDNVTVAQVEQAEKQLLLTQRGCNWRQGRGLTLSEGGVRVGEEGHDCQICDGRRQGERHQGSRQKERESDGGGSFTWCGERRRGAKNCQQLSSPWTELSLNKNTSLFLTCGSPLSMSQHQSTHLCWMGKRQDGLPEPASSDGWCFSTIFK